MQDEYGHDLLEESNNEQVRVRVRVRVSSVVGISVLTSFDPLVRFN